MAPVPVERCIGAAEVGEPRLLADGRHLVHVRTDAAGTVLVRTDLLDGAATVIRPECGLRPGRGLGGGAWCPLPDGRLVVVGADAELWLLHTDGSATRLTDHGLDLAVAAPSVGIDGVHLVYCVEQAQVWSLHLGAGSHRRVDGGSADFVFDPAVHDGEIRWQEWSVPSMPWDDSRIGRATSTETLPSITTGGAVQQVRPDRTGRWWWVCDRDGWLNLKCDGDAVVPEHHEHAGPTWGQGQRSYAVSPDGRSVAFTRNERGFGRLCVADLVTGSLDEVARGVHGQLSWEGDRIAAIRTGARTPTQIVVYDTSTWERTVVEQGPTSEWSSDELVEPELVEHLASDGTVLHARLYRSDDHRGGRLLVWVHGGPTDQWQVTFMPRLAYWCSRGWNVLVPDHRGSTGHGRAYQQALRDRWGELDVADVVAATVLAHEHGWGDPTATVVIGGSAGGFTALGVVASAPDLFAATVVAYPVTDLVDLAERSHRFERHYTDSLVGPLPEAADRYRERSPVQFADRLAAVPMLVLHGDLDPVVPLDQSRTLVERLHAHGGDATLHVYEGEGHGFRQPTNQADEYRRIEAFLDRHVPRPSR